MKFTDDVTGARTLAPGCLLADGQLRLVTFHGARQYLHFWQAVDTQTGRQLALTLVDPAGELSPGYVDEILARTARLRGIDTTGLATVLEVARTSRGGVVVSEWVRGGSLQQVANTAPSPIGAADAVQSLADAAEAAHRVGLPLSIDHPSRVRISTEGDAVLAFPGTMPDATVEADLRGIGGALYELLVNRWPFGDEDDAIHNTEESVAAINPQIPFLISVTTDGLVRQTGGIHSAATVLALLRQADDDVRNASVGGPIRQPAPLPPAGCYAGFGNFGPGERAEAARRQLIKLCLSTAAAVIVAVLMLGASTFSRMVGGGHPDFASVAQRLGLQTPTPPSSSITNQAAPRPPVSVVSVKPTSAAVFSPGGSADSPNSAGLAIDGNPATAWSTDTYFDAVPFPSFKPGVGLLLQLPQPTVVSAVTVDLNSTGTVVQIRSSAGTNPGKLDDTAELTPPMPMQPGHNTIHVANPAPASNVLVWITTLGSTDGKSRADISEITLQGPSPQ